ncbi:hypothetical protein WMY93_014170 [Mugilogobius chulae]|uniref:Uncharacterized protein n=1 Tax=Mugilogobius chulae TaxID=88201 RepID=A0AAW0NYA3_9GOBI
MIVNTVGPLHSYPNGRPRPYSLALGRKIKQRLWEKLNRPLVSVIKSVGDPLQYEQVSAKGPFPPFIEVDISGEPQPEKLCVQKQEQEQTGGLQTEQPRSSSPEPVDEPRRKRPFQVPAQNPEETLSHGSLVMKFTQVPGQKSKYRVEYVSKADQPRSSSPKPEEEPQCKRPFQSVVAAQSHEEPPSQRSLVLKFKQVQKRNRRPTYTVEDVSQLSQVQSSSLDTTNLAPNILQALGLASTTLQPKT